MIYFWTDELALFDYSRKCKLFSLSFYTIREQGLSLPQSKEEVEYVVAIFKGLKIIPNDGILLAMSYDLGYATVQLLIHHESFEKAIVGELSEEEII